MIPYAREAGAVVLLVVAAGWTWLAYDYGHGKGEDGQAAEVARLEAVIVGLVTDAANKRLEHEQAARAAERKTAEALAAAGTAYERGKADAQVTADRTVADLRAGNSRLRQHWQGCVATAELSATAARAGELAAQDRLREASAGRIVGAVAACQAQRDGLIDAVEALTP